MWSNVKQIKNEYSLADCSLPGVKRNKKNALNEPRLHIFSSFISGTPHILRCPSADSQVVTSSIDMASNTPERAVISFPSGQSFQVILNKLKKCCQNPTNRNLKAAGHRTEKQIWGQRTLSPHSTAH